MGKVYFVEYSAASGSDVLQDDRELVEEEASY